MRRPSITTRLRIFAALFAVGAAIGLASPAYANPPDVADPCSGTLTQPLCATVDNTLPDTAPQALADAGVIDINKYATCRAAGLSKPYCISYATKL